MAAARLCGALLLCAHAWAQSAGVAPRVWVQNPVAQHTACPVGANTPSVCTLWGYEDKSSTLLFRVTSLPATGLLYETSGTFRSLGSDPKQMPDPIGPHLLPFLVTDPLHRVVYVPPFNAWPPEGYWASFTYTVEVNRTGPVNASEPGLVVLTNPDGMVAGSSFGVSGASGWSISGNLVDADATSGGLNYQAFAWGSLNRYVYGVDAVQLLDFGSGYDRSKWYFEAAADRFHGTAFTAAYGGVLRFTVRAMYGNFSELNSPLDWVTIECESCDSGQGARIVRFVDDVLRWDGSELTVELPLKPVALWMRDPLNSALDFAYATECDIATVLSNVSRMAILGDFTRGGEGVALDNVAIYQAAPSEQPTYPLTCQKGCVCRHNPDISRPTCC